MWQGLLVGFALGFILKRSRFCFTGTLRDIVLEKRYNNFWIFFTMIFIQSFLYFTFVTLNWIPAPEAESFSYWSVVIGGLIFGVGAVLGNGCCGIAFLKLGDGRPTGLITLVTFALTAAATKQGILSPVNDYFSGLGLVEADLANSLPLPPVVIAAIMTAISVFFMIRNDKKRPKPVSLPPKHNGLRHIFFEKIWSKPSAAILIGIVAGFAWLSSNLTGRDGGLGITTPTVSWLNWFANGVNELNWASFLLVGIVVGTFIATVGSQEYSLKNIDGITLLKSAISGVLMGFGAVIASGCIIGHALVGTSTFAFSSWLGLISITAGIWIATYFIHIRPLEKVKNKNREKGGMSYANS